MKLSECLPGTVVFNNLAPEMEGRILWGIKKHVNKSYQVEVQWIGYERPVYIFIDVLRRLEE